MRVLAVNHGEIGVAALFRRLQTLNLIGNFLRFSLATGTHDEVERRIDDLLACDNCALLAPRCQPAVTTRIALNCGVGGA